MKASDNPYPSVLLLDATPPATPPAGRLRLFVEGGALKLIDEAGVVVATGEVSSADLAAVQGEVDALETVVAGKAATVHNHTSIAITDLTEAVQDILGATLVGSGVSVTYDDGAGTVTVTGLGTTDMEAVRDAIGIAMVGVGAIAVTVDDAGNTITISTTATDRATHTGTQLTSTISDFTEVVQDTVANQITAGAGITKTYDDATGALTITSTASGGGLDLEAVQDAVAAMVLAGTNVTKFYDDTAGTLTINSTASGGGGSGGGTFLGPWNVATSYPAGSVVTYGGSSWGCVAAVAPGQPAPAPPGVVVSSVLVGADNIASAPAIAVATTGETVTSLTFANAAYTTEAGEPSTGTQWANRSAWWKYIPASSGTVIFSGAGGSGDTTMQLFQMTGAPPIDFADLTGVYGDDDTAGSGNAQITAALTAGVTYYIRQGGYSAGNYKLTLTNARATDALPSEWTQLTPPPRVPYTYTDQRDPLTVSAGVYKMPNATGRSLTILQVRVDVVSAPTGAALIIDVNKNGSTIFTTSGNRPSVAAGTLYALSGAVGTPTWANGDTLTVDIDQIGSTVAGGAMTVTIIVEG